MATVGIDCDVILNTKPYRIDVSTYSRRDIVDFSPRGATPTGISVSYSELGLYQTLTQADFRHGIGHFSFTDPSGYQKSAGNIDTRHAGIVTLASQSNSVSDAYAKHGGLTFSGDFYMFGAGGIQKWGGSSFSRVYSTAVNTAFTTGSYIFAAPEGRIQKSSDGSSWSDTGVNTDATDFAHFAIWGGYVWASEEDKNFIHYSGQEDLVDLEGDGTTDTNVVTVGPTGQAVVGLASFSNALYAARPDGLWVISDQNGFTARQVLSFADEVHANNFRGMTVWQGALYFTIRHKIYRWTGSSLQDVSPPRITDTFPYVKYGDFKNLVSRGTHLYCTARTNASTYTESVLAYDGVGWHIISNPITTGTGELAALVLDVDNDYLWYHHDTSTDVSYYMKLQSLSDLPFADFLTTGNHYLYTSVHDMGFKKIQKSVAEVMVESTNCTADRTIIVKYAVDGNIDSDSWTTLGTINSSPSQTLTLSTTVEFKRIQFRFDLDTDDAAQTPVLRSYSLKYMMRPDTNYGYSFDIVSSGYAGHGMDGRKSSAIISDLETARASAAPLAFTNLLGESKTVYVSSLMEIAREREEGSLDDVEHRVRVSLVEV